MFYFFYCLYWYLWYYTKITYLWHWDALGRNVVLTYPIVHLCTGTFLHTIYYNLYLILIIFFTQWFWSFILIPGIVCTCFRIIVTPLFIQTYITQHLGSIVVFWCSWFWCIFSKWYVMDDLCPFSLLCTFCPVSLCPIICSIFTYSQVWLLFIMWVFFWHIHLVLSRAPFCFYHLLQMIEKILQFVLLRNSMKHQWGWKAHTTPGWIPWAVLFLNGVFWECFF